jgi:hypothetical protein
MIEDEVAVISRVPGFLDRCLQLVAWADGDPGTGVIFTELADYVAGLLADVGDSGPTLVHCLAAMETVAATSEDAEELVVWSFLDNLSPDELRRLERWLGPRTRSLMNDADHPAADVTPAG